MRFYNATTNVEAIRRLFDVTNSPNVPDFGDIYPGRQTVAVYAPEGARLVAEMRWGFERPFTKHAINNARAESIDEKPMWRKAFAERRRDRGATTPNHGHPRSAPGHPIFVAKKAVRPLADTTARFRPAAPGP